ncbi:uncharacterized protein LOC133275661 [Pezoporus flaviventris]|nr:uncharacterized protein LOC133275633 [Pezoporus flaviventris]XP_061321665.1 uncharacterized protein LOC133275654 [Pezoporus flaviventris]XP_061321676.1 uncharacterized protein LOC133275661 [Pezoporus flaviventris]
MLLLMMAEQWPGDVILRLVHLSPECDSVAMAMWEVLLSQRLILENSLRELSIRFHYLSVPWRFSTYKAEACIQLLALLASSHVTPKMFAGVYEIRKLLMPPRLLSLVLQGLVTLSQSPDSARKILVMLPDLMEALQSAHSDNKMKALLTFRNVIGHLKKKASSIALELAEKLLQLFDDECSQTQELSICLFKDAIQMADWKDKRQMQKKVRRSLVPLMLHMSDEIESVAKASQEAICAAAKVLKWEWLSHHVQTLERWQTVQRLVRTSPRLDTGCSSHLPTLRMLQEAHLGPGSGTGGSQELQTLLCLQLSLNLSPTGLLAGRHTWPEEQGEVWGAGRRERPRQLGKVCVSPGPLCSFQLEQEQSRAEEYVRQSLLYLQHAQVSVRLAAVRFIGKPRPLESLFWQPGPSPICCTGSEEQPCGCQSIDCPVQGLCSQGLLCFPLQPLPSQRGSVAPCSVPPPPASCPSLGSPC